MHDIMVSGLSLKRRSARKWAGLVSCTKEACCKCLWKLSSFDQDL